VPLETVLERSRTCWRRGRSGGCGRRWWRSNLGRRASCAWKVHGGKEADPAAFDFMFQPGNPFQRATLVVRSRIAERTRQ